MKTDKILASGLTGTSAMTLFSYATSEAKKRNFKEPEVLGLMLDRILPAAGKKATVPTGWFLHYAMGFAFASVYDLIWSTTKFQPSIKNGLILGAISSLVGVGVWDITFKLHPNPPKIHLTRYYGHLVLAHLIFGAFAAAGYKRLNNKSLE